MKLTGKQVILRPSTFADKESIYNWLALSDITQLMLGSPNFSEVKIPTYEEFGKDYVDYFFDGSAPEMGRSFVICVANEQVGQINYNLYGEDDCIAELDIWLKGKKYLGKGYGSEAIEVLCNYLFTALKVKKIIIAPSARNIRAIKAYQKAGFVISKTTKTKYPDYDDAVTLIKILQ